MSSPRKHFLRAMGMGAMSCWPVARSVLDTSTCKVLFVNVPFLWFATVYWKFRCGGICMTIIFFSRLVLLTVSSAVQWLLCIYLWQFRVFAGIFSAVWKWVGSCCKDIYYWVVCLRYILLQGYLQICDVFSVYSAARIFTDVFCECIVHPANRMFTGLGCLQYSISAASLYIVTALQRV